MILLYQDLLYQEQLRLLILRYRVATLQIVENSTCLVVLQMAGIFSLMVGRLVELSSLKLLGLEIPPANVPAEQVLLRMFPRMATIGSPGLSALPTLAPLASALPTTCSRSIITIARSASLFDLP